MKASEINMPLRRWKVLMLKRSYLYRILLAVKDV
jgi:hypothetical protein